LGIWEQLYNPNFKLVEFDHFRMQAGLRVVVFFGNLKKCVTAIGRQAGVLLHYREACSFIDRGAVAALGACGGLITVCIAYRRFDILELHDIAMGC